MEKPKCPIHNIEMVVRTMAINSAAAPIKSWVCPTKARTNCRYIAPYLPYHDLLLQYNELIAPDPPASAIEPPSIVHLDKPNTEPKFKFKDRVQLRADPTRTGRVLEDARQYPGGYEYLVYFGSEEAWYAEPLLEPVTYQGRPRWGSRDAFLRDLTLTKLRSQLSDSFYSYGASRTYFVPYQFKPTLKFLRNPDQRILIADEVGLGKTIEAAIIYLELKARLDISRVLILCPSRLKDKWKDEMRNRFEEEFIDLDTRGLNKILEDFARYGQDLPFRAIASFEMMRRAEFIDQLVISQIPIDLLIVDEAHYMRNESTHTYELGIALTDVADAVVFLTATPLHLHNRDLYNLLHLLAPGEFSDLDIFEDQVAPNQFINQAARYLAAGMPGRALDELRRVESTPVRDRFLRNPYYAEVLNGIVAAPTEPRERVELQRNLLELNTLSTYFTRTRKREVEQAAVRAAFTIEVELSPAERAFYDGVLAQVRQELGLARKGAPSFAVIMKERQAASCLAAAREAFEESARSPTAITLGLDKSEYELFDSDTIEVPTTSTLLQLSRTIGNTDAKFDKFADTLDRALAPDPTSKALVFSFFRRTLTYLYKRLKALGYDVDVIHGGIKTQDRRRIIERFRTDPRMRILLSSEVGAEGLDFQFCDILVNYDLPWNPMQVEQRIGRLDRFGQQHERIRIYNFYIAETVETRIFQRLYDRLHIFERSIGDLEAVLGEVILELSQSVLQANLTPDEQKALSDNAANRIVRQQLEEEDLNKNKDQLLGHEGLFNQQVQDTITSGRYVSSEEVRALVSTFLEEAFSRTEFSKDDEEPCWTLRMDPDLSNYVRKYIASRRDVGQGGKPFWDAMADRGRVALTFDSELARQRPNLEFITTRHPLAAAAADYWRKQPLQGIPSTRLQISGPPEEAGDGYFYIYMLDVAGLTRTRTLIPVVVSNGQFAPVTSELLLSQLQSTATQASLETDLNEFLHGEQLAAAQVATHRDKVEQETRRRNAALTIARHTSIVASFEAKISRAEGQLANATNDRIQRMYTGQVRNLRVRMELKLDELNKNSDVAVSSALVAGGRVLIVPSTSLPLAGSTLHPLFEPVDDLNELADIPMLGLSRSLGKPPKASTRKAPAEKTARKKDPDKGQLAQQIPQVEPTEHMPPARRSRAKKTQASEAPPAAIPIPQHRDDQPSATAEKKPTPRKAAPKKIPAEIATIPETPPEELTSHDPQSPVISSPFQDTSAIPEHHYDTVPLSLPPSLDVAPPEQDITPSPSTEPHGEGLLSTVRKWLFGRRGK